MELKNSFLFIVERILCSKCFCLFMGMDWIWISIRLLYYNYVGFFNCCIIMLNYFFIYLVMLNFVF